VRTPPFQLFAVTAPGLEEPCARELRTLAMHGVAVVPGGVEFAGDLRDLYRANLWLRTASRVLVRVGEVKCRDFPELYHKALRLPWGRFVRPGSRVTVRAASRRSRLQHTGRIAETVVAAVDHALGRPGGPPEGPEQLVLVRFEEDLCHLSVDSSGELLHRRGYRSDAVRAPLRETLAAAILAQLGWDGSTPLYDPMCGSGTLLIEAALLACNLPPGGARRFAFMDWPRYRPGLWQVLLEEAAGARRACSVAICGADRDLQAVAAAQRNAERAGVADQIDLRHLELGQTPPAKGVGLLLCNPPYGERLGRAEDLRPLFRLLGEVCRRAFPGWRVALLSPADALAGATGLPLRRVAALNNGGIAVSLWAGGT